MKKQGRHGVVRSFTLGSASYVAYCIEFTLSHANGRSRLEESGHCQLLIRSDRKLSRIAAVLETSCDSWHLSIRACKTARQWPTITTVQSECCLDHE